GHAVTLLEASGGHPLALVVGISLGAVVAPAARHVARAGAVPDADASRARGALLGGLGPRARRPSAPVALVGRRLAVLDEIPALGRADLGAGHEHLVRLGALEVEHHPLR